MSEFETDRAIIKGRERMRDKHGIGQAIVMITQLSINMLVPVFMCLFIGIWLDKRLGKDSHLGMHGKGYLANLFQ